jgi:hypothetical protein
MFRILIALVVAPTLGTAQDTQQAVLEIIPESLTLSLNGHATVTVVLRNGNARPLTNVQLSWLSNEGVMAAAPGPRLSRLASYAAHRWTLDVSRPAGAPLAGTLYVRTDFEWQRGEAGAPIPATAIRALAVRAPEAEKADGWATVQLLTALTSLQERRPGKIYLVVTNKTADSLCVGRVASHVPSFVTAVVADRGLAAEPLPPGETRTLTVDVTIVADSAIKAGKHLLVFELPLARGRAGASRRATLIASQQIDVGAFGDSELLTLLGVPSFLVLPGFLIVATIGLLWTYCGLRNATGAIPAFPFRTKDADFWMIAVTLSVISAFVYPIFTRRNYLDGYGMRDVAGVWIGCVVLSLAAFGIVTGVWRWKRWDNARKLRDRVPAEADDQLVTLEKLARRGLSLTRPQVEVTVGGNPQRGFLLAQNLASTDGLWVAPGVTITALGGAPPEVLTQRDTLLQEGQAAAVAEFLRSEEAQQWLKLAWQPQGAFTGPQRFPRADLRPVKGPVLSMIEVV